MKSLNLLQPFGLLALRLALGVIFFAHGYPKLAHLGGGMQEFFVQHGLPGYFVYVAGVLEVFGGLLLMRSEEHTSELQSRLHLVCRLLLEKKKRGHGLMLEYTS